MPTTITKSIGTTGRDYSTIQAWEDALPANLVTADELHVGECYNDSEFTVTSTVTIAGQTTDVTRYIELIAAIGHSFSDHANVRTNALKYDVSKGVGLRKTNNYGTVLSITTDYTRLIKMQIKHGGGVNLYALNVVAASFIGAFLILENQTTVARIKSNGGGLVNSIAWNLGTTGDGIQVQENFTVLAVTVIRPFDITPVGTGMQALYTNVRAKNCAIFGFSAAMNASYQWDTANTHHNATDLASGLHGANNQHSVTFSSATPFVDANTTTRDGRLANDANALINNGILLAGWEIDITQMSRNDPPEIGAWELTAIIGKLSKGLRVFNHMQIFRPIQR